MQTIVEPSRALLMELFPLTEDVPLDSKARGELRALATIRRTADAMLENLLHLDQTCSPQVDAPELAANHYLVMMTAFHRNAGKPTDPESWHGAYHDMLSSMPDDAFAYHLQSRMAAAACASLSGVTQVEGGQMLFPVNDTMQAMARVVTLLANCILNNHYQRRYPAMRFLATQVAILRIEWDVLDAEGVPRVALDGYHPPRVRKI